MKEALIKGWASVSERWRLFAYVVLGVLAVSLISNWVLSRSKRYPSHVVARVKTLVKDAAKWAAVAQQDQNPLMGLVHATYAMAYINVAREMFSAKDLQTLCGIDTDELYTMINHTQEQTAQQVGTQCPGLKLPGVFGLYSGWLGNEMEEIVFRPGSVEENDQFKREAIKLSLAGVGVSLGAFTVSIAEEDYSTTSKCSWFRVASDENRRYLVKYVGSELEFVGTEHDLPNRDLHVLKKLPLEIPEVSCTLHWSSDLKLMLNDREVTVLHMYHHNVDLCSDAPFGLRDIKAEDLDFIEALRVPSQDRGDLLALFCNRWVYGPCPVAAFLHVQTAVIYLWQSGIWDYPEGLCIRQCGDDFEMLTTYGSSYVTPIWAATSYDPKAKCNWIASNSEWTPLEIPSEFCSLHDWIVFGVTWSDFPLSDYCQYDTPRNTNQTPVPFESFRVSIASHSLRDLDKKDADVQKRVMQLYLHYAAHYEKWLRLGPGKDQSEPWSRGLKASEILNHNVACVLVMLGRIEEAYRQLVKDRSFLQVWASTEELRDDPALNPVKDLALKSL